MYQTFLIHPNKIQPVKLFLKILEISHISKLTRHVYLFDCISHGDSKYSLEIPEFDIFWNCLWNVKLVFCSRDHAGRVRKPLRKRLKYDVTWLTSNQSMRQNDGKLRIRIDVCVPHYFAKGVYFSRTRRITVIKLNFPYPASPHNTLSYVNFPSLHPYTTHSPR